MIMHYNKNVWDERLASKVHKKSATIVKKSLYTTTLYSKELAQVQ